MTRRTSSKTVTFCRSFRMDGVDRLLPPADYQVVTEEELIESLSFFGLPSGFDGHDRAGRVRIHSRDGDHRSLRPSGSAGRRCSNKHPGDGVRLASPEPWGG